MKKLFLFLILLAFEPRLATAQVVKTAVVPEKVTYSRTIPKSLRAFVPRGGKTRFWGATNLKYNGQQVWVHVYDLQKMNADGVQKSGLDLFTLFHSHRVKRISSTRFDYQRDGDYRSKGSYKTIGIESVWLNSSLQKISAFKMTLRSPSSGFGEDGEDILATFNLRLKTSAAIQNFKYGWDSSSDRNGWHSDFERSDDGFLQIKSVHSSFIGTKTTLLAWNGKSFVSTNTQFEKRKE